MIVCVCHRVSDREIARHVRAGMSFDDIQLELGVATQCGQCESCARDVVAQCGASPMAAVHCDFEPTQAGRNFDTLAAPASHAHVSVVQLASAIKESRAWNSSQSLHSSRTTPSSQPLVAA